MKILRSVLHKGEEPGSFKKSQQGRKRDGAKGLRTREGGSWSAILCTNEDFARVLEGQMFAKFAKFEYKEPGKVC